MLTIIAGRIKTVENPWGREMPGIPSNCCTAGAVQSAKKSITEAKIIAEMSPSQILPVIAWTIAPTNAKCQKFQMSMLIVFVTREKSRIRLIRIPNGITNAAISDPNAIAAEAGQPTSMILSSIPKRSTIALAAGPRLSNNIPRTIPIPINPTPTINALRTAFPGLAPKATAIIKIIIGKKTLAPRSKKNCTKL